MINILKKIAVLILRFFLGLLIFLKKVAVFSPRFLLGLFILWHLFYLVAANLLPLVEEVREDLPERFHGIADYLAPGWRKGKDDLYKYSHKAETILEHYGEATAQTQSWSLFAPNVADQIPFPAVELRWPKGRQPVWLFSENEPTRRDFYFRFSRFRLRRFEQTLTVTLTVHGDESADGKKLDTGSGKGPKLPKKMPRADRNVQEKFLSQNINKKGKKRWAKKIRDEVVAENRIWFAYLKCRSKQYIQEHPGTPQPSEVILHVRRFRVLEPPGPTPWDWKGPYVVPLARWRPNVDPPKYKLPVEAYDPVSGEFTWVTK